MPLTPITSWSLQSPDATVWVPSVSTAGVISWTSGGAPITVTPPVFQGTPSSVVWTPAISNAGVVSYTSGTAAGQYWASLLDANGVQWYFEVDASGILTVVSRADFVLDEVALYSGELSPTRINTHFAAQDGAHENLLADSEDFSASTWGKDHATVSPNLASTPFGVATGADKLIEDATTNYHRTFQTFASAYGDTLTLSVYAKQAERTRFSLQITDGLANYAYAQFNLAAASSAVVQPPAGSATAAMEYFASTGYYRCSLTWAGTNVVSPYAYIYLADASGNISYAGDGTSGLYLWGGMAEVSATVSSYAPTPGAAGGVGTYAEEVLADNPVGYWRLGAPPVPTTVPDAWPQRPITVELNGASWREQVLVDTLRVNDTLGEQATAEFTVVNPAVNPVAGDKVRVLYHRLVLFAGTIGAVQRTANNTNTARLFQCRATDYSQILVRRKVRRNFVDLPVSNIVDSVVDNELAGEGVTIGVIDRSSSIPLAESRGASCFEFFRDLAGVTGQTFYIDHDKQLRFNTTSNLLAPVLTQDNVEDAVLSSDRESYRNRQTVTCAGTPAQGATAYEVTVTEDNAVEIAERAAVEGGTGVYEDVEQITHPTSNDGADVTLLALGYARLRLATSGQLRSTLKCRTRAYGFRAGQFCDVTLPRLGVSGTWLVQRCAVTEQSGRLLVHDLELVQSTLQQRVFESWLKIVQGKKITVQMPGSITTNLASFATPGTYTWTVPAGVTTVELTCYGPSAGGCGGAWVEFTNPGIFQLTGSSGPATGGRGGHSGKAVTTIPVTEGSTITVIVGAAGVIGANQYYSYNWTSEQAGIHGISGSSGTSGAANSSASYNGSIVCQGNAGLVGTVAYSEIANTGTAFVGSYANGSAGSPGSGIGDAVSVGGGFAGGAGGVQGTSPVIGHDGLVEIRY